MTVKSTTTHTSGNFIHDISEDFKEKHSNQEATFMPTKSCLLQQRLRFTRVQARACKVYLLQSSVLL